MTATELLDRLTDQRAPVLPGGSQSVVYTGLLLDHAVLVEADRPLPVEATRLLDRLNQEWDVRRRHSDLDRVSAYPNVMISVSQPTRSLLDNTLAAIYLARLAGLDVGAGQAILDHRHGRIGADPDVVARMARLVPATAADLLADICHAAGIRTGSIRVGAAVHHLGEPVEAWLAQATDDITHALDERQRTRSR